jgi:hypothetical protein
LREAQVLDAGALAIGFVRRRLLKLAGAAGPTKARARALFAAGVLAGEQGDCASADTLINANTGVPRLGLTLVAEEIRTHSEGFSLRLRSYCRVDESAHRGGQAGKNGYEPVVFLGCVEKSGTRIRKPQRWMSAKATASRWLTFLEPVEICSRPLRCAQQNGRSQLAHSGRELFAPT